MTGHHGRHRPYIHIRSTPTGQQLPNLKSLKVTALFLAYKKFRGGGGALRPPSPPGSLRVKVYHVLHKIKLFLEFVNASAKLVIFSQSFFRLAINIEIMLCHRVRDKINYLGNKGNKKHYLPT